MERTYFFLSGVGLSLLGALLLIRRLRLFLYGIRTNGILVGWEPRGRKVFYHPVLEFTATDGSIYRVTSLTGYSKKIIKDFYCIIYLKNKPSEALVYSFLHFWAAPFTIFLIAAAPLWLLLKSSFK